MRSADKIIKLLIAGSLLLSGCATYHMTPQSLVQQLAATQTEKKVTVIIAFPLFFPGVVTGNTLEYVTVLDKNEKEVAIPVTNRTGIRITKKDGERNTFYFNTLIIRDSTVTGKKDHFIGVPIEPINLNAIQKIELQKN
jgi:hypothetical protein